MKLLYTVQNNVIMYNYTFYHPLYSVRVSISYYYVLHVAMLVLLIDYSSKYKSYASEPSLCSGTEHMHVLDQLFPLPDVSASILPECMFIVQVFC